MYGWVHDALEMRVGAPLISKLGVKIGPQTPKIEGPTSYLGAKLMILK